MTIAVYVSVYVGVLVFLIGSVIRVITYARQPVHLRWELYPVPHEDPSRANHGGSCFETGDWWVKPRHLNRMRELRAMVAEIALLKALREFNRGLWYASFLFHLGLYLSVATAMLISVSVAIPAVAGGSIASFLHALYVLVGHAAVALTLMGAMALLFRRLADPEVKNYTTPADIFNLLFFLVAYATVAAGYLVRPENSANVNQFIRGLVRCETSLTVGRGFGAGLILSSVLIAYIPFTHMAHFIAKYFTYHLVRWDDRPNVRGGKIEARVASYLALRPTWSAAHIGANGRKTWAEVASANPVAEVRK